MAVRGAQPTPLLDLPLQEHMGSFLGPLGAPWFALPTFPSPRSDVPGKAFPPAPGPLGSVATHRDPLIPLRFSPPVLTLAAQILKSEILTSTTRGNIYPKWEPVQAPGNLETASIPERSCGTKWTLLFATKTELGRKATAHRCRDSFWVKFSIAFLNPGPGFGGWSWRLELEAGAGAKGNTPLDSVPSQRTADPPGSICGPPQDRFHGHLRLREALEIGVGG